MIHRSEHKNKFLRLDYIPARDARLSFEARGLLVFLLTMSDTWDFTIRGIASQSGKSERVIMRLVKELKAAGYIKQKKQQDGKGRFGCYVWHIYEVPELHENDTSGDDPPNYTKTELRKNRASEKPNFGKCTRNRTNKYIRTNNLIEQTNIQEEEILKKPDDAPRSYPITSITEWLKVREEPKGEAK